MKSLVAILALVAVAAADVSHLSKSADQVAVVEHQSSDVRPDGFDASYRTSNGIAAQESGQLQKIGNDEVLRVQGSSSYVSPDGGVIETSYVADENGYQPQGAHLPTAPPAEPIPEYIQRALAYIAAHPPQPEPVARKL